MLNIIFFLRRIVALPYELVTSPFRAAGDVWTESGRGQSLLLGVPSVLLAGLGLAAFGYAEYSGKAQLERQYEAAAENCSEKKVELFGNLQTEIRANAAEARELANQGKDVSKMQVGISKEDERLVKLNEWRSAEQIYLEKLISLNPDNPDYRFRLAIISMELGDIQKGTSLMETIAPEDEPGYAKAHLYMARTYLSRRPTSRGQAVQYIQKAERHADHCLLRDKNNFTAMQIKASILKSGKQHHAAREVYKQLFEQSPKHFQEIVALNKLLGEESDSIGILVRAADRLKKMTEDTKLSSNEWSQAWNLLTTCLIEQREYVKCETLLKEEIVKQVKATEKMLKDEQKNPGTRKLIASSTEAKSRRVAIERLLSKTYTRWANSLYSEGSPTEPGLEASTAEQLELLKKAYKIDRNRNPTVLRLLTRIGASGGPLAEQALAVYDGRNDENAPSAVLSELGTRALIAERYDDAIQYFEGARLKAPNNAAVLNNLAYTYLVCENQNPEQALSYVDTAINIISTSPDSGLYLSHFYDTRGRALMALDPPRMEQAIASFEFALKSRPDDREILESLLKCHGEDSRDGLVIKRRLESLDNPQPKNK